MSNFVTVNQVTVVTKPGQKKTKTQDRIRAETKTYPAGSLLTLDDEDTINDLIGLGAIRDPLPGETVVDEDGVLVEIKARSISPVKPAKVDPNEGKDMDALVARAKELKVKGVTKSWPAATIEAKIAEAEAEIAEKELQEENERKRLDAEKAAADAEAAAAAAAAAAI